MGKTIKAPLEDKTQTSEKDQAATKGASAEKFYFSKNNPKAALPLAMEACAAGNLKSCSLAGRIYQNPKDVALAGVAQDTAKALSLFKKAVEGGYIGAYSNLFYFYRDYAGGDNRAALTAVLTTGCNRGNAYVCELGAETFASDHAVVSNIPKNPALALDFLQKACLLGGTEGYSTINRCQLLGDLYRGNIEPNDSYGIRVSPDRAQAIAYYRRACAGSLEWGNVATGCLALKQMNATDKGIANDYAQSLAINRKYCTVKFSNDCSDLGIMYENGLGVQTDLNKAIALYTQACNGKDQDGCAALKRLGK